MALTLGNRTAFKAPAQSVSRARPARALRPVIKAAAVSASEAPDMDKRNIMNLLLLGGIGLPVAGLAGPYAVFFVPKM